MTTATDQLRQPISLLENVPDMLREKRDAMGISQREAARQIGISFSTVSRIEAGEWGAVKSWIAILKWIAVGSGQEPE